MTEKCAGRDVDPDGDFECDRCDPDNIRFDGQETCEANWGKGKKKKPERIKLVNPDYYDNGTVEVDMQGKTLLKLPVLKRETGNIKVIWEKDGAISYKSIKCIKKVVERPEGPESPPPRPMRCPGTRNLERIKSRGTRNASQKSVWSTGSAGSMPMGSPR